MPSKSANVKIEKQYEALKDKGMSKSRAARIANSPKASNHGGKKSGSGWGQQAGRNVSPEEGGWSKRRQSHGTQVVMLE